MKSTTASLPLDHVSDHELKRLIEIWQNQSASHQKEASSISQTLIREQCRRQTLQAIAAKKSTEETQHHDQIILQPWLLAGNKIEVFRKASKAQSRRRISTS